MTKITLGKIDNGAAVVFVFGIVLFALGFALHYFILDKNSPIDKLVASPLAAGGLGIVGGIAWGQRRNFNQITLLIILGAVLLFVAVWFEYLVNK